MSGVSLADSTCRVQQAQQVISLWLEATAKDDTTAHLLGALLTLLDGIPELMDAVEDELTARDLIAGVKS